MSWNDHLDRLDAVVAQHFDTVLCTAVAMKRPERAVNAAPAADTSGPSFTFKGSLDADPEMQKTGSAGPQRAVTKVCLTALTERWPWVPRQDDRIEIDGALYQIAATPERDGTSRLAFWLNKLTV